MTSATSTSSEFTFAGALLSDRERASLSARLAVSMVAAGCLLLSGAIRYFAPSQSDVANLVAGLAALLVAIPAFRAAWHSIRKPDLHGVVDQLIALAVLGAWASGSLVTAALLPLVMTLGNVLEERSLLGSQDAIRALTRLTHTKARRVSADEAIEEISAGELRPGDVVDIRAGDLFPADGTVESGSSSVDLSSITGESVPVEVEAGSTVLNGSINLNGHLRVRISRVGSETTLGRVVSLLREAELAKPPITRLLERYAERYLVLVLLFAAAAWLLSGSTTVLLAVLVASCPAALVFAAPATAIAGIAVASRHGILIKGAAFLEGLATVDAVAFDKTGTVTSGLLQVVRVCPEPDCDTNELLRVAASLGAVSSHPVSRALAEHVSASERLELEEVKEPKGLGVMARLAGGDPVALGRSALFAELGIAASPPPEHAGPMVGVGRGGRFLGWILFEDAIRPEAAQAVAELRELGLRHQILITGDRASAAKSVAEALQFTDVSSELLPEQKMQRILAELQAGRRPLVVGDGINDALALKAGAVGIAMGGRGTDVALASADLVLMSNDLRRLATSIRLSRRCRATIYVNVAIGLVWTVSMMAGAIMGLLDPVTAAILQNMSAIIVLFNAGRLLKFQETVA